MTTPETFFGPWYVDPYGDILLNPGVADLEADEGAKLLQMLLHILGRDRDRARIDDAAFEVNNSN